MKNLLSNLIDFFGKRINAPPIYKNLKIFLLSHEKIYNGYVFVFVLKNQLKNLKVMERKILLLFLSFIFFSHILFSQNATINGNICPFAFPTSCLERVCEGQKFPFVAETPLGTPIDSVKWYEQKGDVNGTWSSPVLVSQVQTIHAPVTEDAALGRRYRYTLVVYSGGSPYSAAIELDVNALPNATLNVSSNSICAGSGVLFTALGGINYEFRVNSTTYQNGIDNQFSTSSLNNNDTVKVVVTNSNGCSTTSSPIVMTVRPRPDAASVTPSSTCLGEGMNWTYSGLTGTGPWVVSFWDPTHTTQYGPDYIVTNPNGSLNDVPIPYGTPSVHFKIQDNHCPNF